MNEDDDDTITVTSATSSEEEIRAQLGLEKAPPVVEDPPAEGEVVEEGEDAEADESDEPEPTRSSDVSDAARTLSETRTSSRRKRVSSQVALIEDSIRRLGGTVPAMDKREYKTAQAEVDHLTRRRYDLDKVYNDLLRRGVTPPAQRPPAQAPRPQAQDGGVPAPAFKFQTWEEYQNAHPEAPLEEWLDKRDDARREFFARADNEKQSQAEAKRATDAAVVAFNGHVKTFAETHADFDEKTSAIALDVQNPRFQLLRIALLRAGNAAPKVQYYLAHHQEELDELMAAPSQADFIDSFGAIKYAAKREYPDVTPGAAPAARPKNSAPDPLRKVNGGAKTTRSLAAVAEDDDDADAYIAIRRKQMQTG